MSHAARTGQVLWRVAKYGLASFGAVAVVWLAYEGFLRPVDFAPVDPETLGKVWDDTVAQFGIAPVFPPREDVQVGDVYAVLGEHDGDHRPKLMGHRAIKLDHLTEVDAKLAPIYKNVIVLPKGPANMPKDGAIAQVQCPDGCFEYLTTRTELPLVILPGIRASQARQAALQGGFLSKITRNIFGGSSGQSQSISLSIPYAEVYGLPSLQASGILQDYCNDADRPKLCSEAAAREQLAMVAGDLPWEHVPNSDRYASPVYIVLISAVYLKRSVTYGFSADSAVGIQAQVYKDIERKLQADVQSPSASAAGPSVGAAEPGNGPNGGDASTAQRAAAAERQRLAQIIAEAAGAPTGGSLNVETSASNRVIINQTLPRPVTIGFIPVMKDFRPAQGKKDIVEPSN